MARLITTAALAVGLALSSLPARADVTLELPSYQLQQGFGAWWRGAASAFEAEHPGVKINLIDVPFGDHHKQLTTRLIAGNPPDLLHISARYFYSFADEGLLEPLDDYLASAGWKESDFIPGQADMRRNGHIYAQLLLGYSYGLYYNAEMLEKAGVAVPTDITSMMDAAKKLTVDRDGDGRADQFGLLWPTANTNASYIYLTYMLTGLGKDWVGADGKLVSRDDLRAAVAKVDELLAMGATPPGLDVNPARQMFWQGDAAMYIDGSWAVADRERAAEQVKNHYAVAPVPLKGEAGGPSNVLAVPAGLPDDRRKAALDFVAFVSSKHWQEEYALISGNPPARLGSITQAAYEKWKELPIFEKSAAEYRGSFMPRGLEGKFSDVDRIVRDAITAMVSKQMTAEQAADAIHDQMSALF